jgi:DNA polymerase III subunit epsilon
MLDRPLVFLDLETTGATASHDRITEVGLIEVERGAVCSEWSTLVNPGRRIPPYVEALTGITNEMVALAPTFAEIGPGLKARLEGKLLVAHNARFDYGFLKSEFRRIDVGYRAQLLCTVKLSRKLFPHHRRHNLDSLMERHNVVCSARHRALGDARVLWDLVRKWAAELGGDALREAAAAQLARPRLPPGLSEAVLDELPETPGVYLFFGEGDAPLYVGKSVNLRSRVLAHFSGDLRATKDARIVQQVRRVEWRQTVGELGALLEEARLVKDLLPVHNRALRRNSELCAFVWKPGDEQPPRLVGMADIDFGDTAGVYGVFRSQATARETLRNLARAHELCLIAIGLEKGKGPCFAHQLERCRGACVGREPRLQHDLRLMQALARIKFQSWPFAGRIGIREVNGDDTELHVLDQWCYLGSVRSEQDLDVLAAKPQFDLDTYRILRRHLLQENKTIEIVKLGAASTARASTPQ